MEKRGKREKSEHGAYVYDPSTGAEYYCGIKVINIEEQLAYINHAASFATRSAKVKQRHAAQYNTLEAEQGKIRRGAGTAFTKDKPEGYCKTNHSGDGTRHSLSPHTSHLCAECLARYLVSTRACTLGIQMMCNVSDTGGDTEGEKVDLSDVSERTKITVRFSKGVCELLFGRSGDAVTTTEFMFIVRNGQMPLLEIPTLRKYRGSAVASLIGIPICATLLNGGECLSRVDNTDFSVSSVPISYPAWTEVTRDMVRPGSKNFPGQVWVHVHCKKCHEQSKIIIPPSPTPSEDGADPSKLREENRELRAAFMELAIRVKELSDRIQPPDPF